MNDKLALVEERTSNLSFVAGALIVGGLPVLARANRPGPVLTAVDNFPHSQAVSITGNVDTIIRGVDTYDSLDVKVTNHPVLQSVNVVGDVKVKADSNLPVDIKHYSVTEYATFGLHDHQVYPANGVSPDNNFLPTAVVTDKYSQAIQGSSIFGYTQEWRTVTSDRNAATQTGAIDVRQS